MNQAVEQFLNNEIKKENYYTCLENLPRLNEFFGEHKENKMEFLVRPDFAGCIRKIGDHFLIMIGCEEVIADDIKSAGKAIAKILEKAYKEKE